MKLKNESGIALITTLLILLLLGVLLEGFIVSVNSDQNLTSVDRDQNRSFYAALAGLEQLTASLGSLYDTNYAPTSAQIAALTTTPPDLPYTSFVSPGGGSGYQIQYPTTASGKPQADNRTIPTGPYEGLVGMITPFTMTVTARTATGGEVRMRRTLQTIEVPVFQFGIFSETDLSFFAGPNFDFGGRVHTNGNLFLAEGSGSTLTMKDRVTAVGEIIRTHLNNDWDTSSFYTGNVSVITSPGAYRNLTSSEGSLTGKLGSAKNSGWTDISIGTYNGNIRNGDTGARRMDLPLVSMGATPIDLIRRPAKNSNENTANPDVFKQRYFSMASLRIILSDTEADITSLPTITTGSPAQLVNPLNIGTQKIGESHNSADSDFKSIDGTPLIGGYIKIEMQDSAKSWHDVTQEILALGISGRDLTGSAGCSTYYPDSIIRVQRLKDNPATYPSCTGSSNQQYQFWPNVLYDTREGLLRDNISTGDNSIYLSGVMHYVELDVTNLARWFRGLIGTTGSNAIKETGYVVYFSDRRTNKNGTNETGEFGYEDFVNRASITNGTPNGFLDIGEDVNQNNIPDNYGKTPQLPPQLPAGASAPLDGNAHPWTSGGVTVAIARKNRPIFFRRALKLANGASFDLGTDTDGVPYGLAVASENPVYVQGNYNAPGTFDNDHRACSIIADAVTLLSNSWNDKNSLTSPNNPGNRKASDTWYRTAVIAGKGVPFPNIDMTDDDKRDFGTDGGVHNFLRYLEDWDKKSLRYRGSIVSLFYNRQATGTYKCCTNVYAPPTRGYAFDVEFLEPSLLPPRTPMFHDVNITGFTQIKMPNK